MPYVHVTPQGTYHPDPEGGPAWIFRRHDSFASDSHLLCASCGRAFADGELFALCLDGGDVLCTECADMAGIEVVDCDCP